MAAIASNGLTGSILTVIILSLMYWLFLLEGLLVVMTQLRSSDAEGARQYVERHLTPRQRGVAEWFVTLAHGDRFHLFVNGRQILVVILIVAIASLVTVLPLHRTLGFFAFFNLASSPFHVQHHPTSWLDSAWGQVGNLAYLTLKHPILAAIISALFPCWAAQLLPQRLALDRNFEFIRLWGSPELTCLSLWVARAGAGWPGEALVWCVQRLGGFDGREHIDIGMEKIFDHQCAAASSFIDLRELEVTADAEKCTVRDVSTIIFQNRPTHYIWTAVRLFKPKVREAAWEYRFPEGVHPDSEEKVIRLRVSSAEANGSGGEEALVDGDIVVATKVSLSPPLPRSHSQRKEHGVIIAEYTTQPLDLGQNTTDRLIIDISGLTKKLRVTLTVSEPSILMEPSVRLERTVALLSVGDGIPLSDRYIDTKSDGVQKWTIDISYPPPASQAIILIDARRPSHPRRR